MLVFPNDFVKTKKLERYNIRLLPNISELGNIATSSKKKNFLLVNRYYSYALINRYDTPFSKDKFKISDISIIQYDDTVYDFINAHIKELFDLKSSYSLIYDIRYNKSIDLKYLFANGNVIYSDLIPSKSNRLKIEKWLLKADKTIEELAIENSDEPHKSELIKKCITIVRDKKIEELIKIEK